MKEEIIKIADRLKNSEMPESEAIRELLLTINPLPMFNDDSKKGNEKREQLITYYKNRIPFWRGTYSQGFADCFNWLSSVYEKVLNKKNNPEV